MSRSRGFGVVQDALRLSFQSSRWIGPQQRGLAIASALDEEQLAGPSNSTWFDPPNFASPPIKTVDRKGKGKASVSFEVPTSIISHDRLAYFASNENDLDWTGDEGISTRSEIGRIVECRR